MRRIFSAVRASVITSVFVVLYTMARWWASSGHSPSRFPDSLGYSHLQFFGHNDRFWAVPFLYSLVNTDHQRVLLQIFVGAAAWSYAAWVASKYSRYRITMTALVLLVGLTPQVIRFDLAILSESLGISYGVIAMAATVHLTHSRRRSVRWVWITSVVLVAFTRPSHLLLLVLLAIWMTVRATLRRDARNKRLAIIFVSLSIWGVMQLNGNKPQSTVNFYTLIQKRLCLEPAMNQWFLHHGMPRIDGLCASKGYAYAYDIKNTVGEILQLPEGQQPLATMVTGDVAMANWVVSNGWSTYSQYLVAHPQHIIDIVAANVNSALDARSSEFLPTDVRTIIPENLVKPWWLWAFTSVVCIGFTVSHSSRRKHGRALIAIALFVSTIFVAGLLTSAVELERHSVTTVAALRLLTVLALAGAFARPTTALVENADVHDE